MLRMRRVVTSLSVVALLVGPCNPCQAQRPLTVADVLQIESIGQVVPSPTDDRAAIVIKRGIASASRFTVDYLDGLERGDVWLLADSGGAPRRITPGVRTGTGFWSPAWSPNGRMLAMLSTQGGDNVRLYTWDSRSG